MPTFEGGATTRPIPAPVGKPHPLLLHNNVPDVETLNTRAKAAVQAHEQATGQRPSPHLVYDLVRSDLPVEQFPSLFRVTSPQQAQAVRANRLHREQNPQDYFVTRPDGIVQPTSPLLNLTPRLPPAPSQKLITPALQKRYPMVMMGALPIPNLDGVLSALRELNQPSHEEAAATVPTNIGYGLPAKAAAYYNTSPINSTAAARSRRVQTVKQAQEALNKQMGTSLPVTGVFNDTWLQAVSNWQHTTDYFHKQLEFQAEQEGFGKNVGAYVKAWKAKQKAVQHGLYGHFLSAMPLPLFGHGSFWQDVASVPGYLKGGSKNPLNIGLHALVRSAGLTLDTVGGTVSQAKADLAAGTTLAAAVSGLHGPNVTYEEALREARKQLNANPSWLRIAALGYLPENEKGRLLALDEFTNLAGDLILLRKPAFTGERVAAGDLAAASKSTYVNVSAGWAYKALQKYGQDGIGRAAARLEGGNGARELVARAEPLVRRGLLTQEQFAQHVAELYADGRTTLTLPRAGSKVVERPVEQQAFRTEEDLSALTERERQQLTAARNSDFRLGQDEQALVDRIEAKIVKKKVPYTVTKTARERVPGEPVTVEITGTLLPSLRTAKIPAPGKAGQWLLDKKHGLRDALDEFDSSDAANGVLVGRANALVNTIRAAVGHAVSPGTKLGYFQDILPERVFNFVRKHELGDDPAALANKLESDLVRFQGKQNVRGIQQVEQTIRKLWHEKYGQGSPPADDPFRALLETEAPSVFSFPGGIDDAKAIEATNRIAVFTAKMNAGLNKAAKIHARIILSGVNPFTGFGGFSLMWKHSVGDGLRAVVAGIGDALTPEVQAARKELRALADSDPAISRQYGALLDRLRTGETRWALNRGGHSTLTKSFDTGEQFGSKTHMTAAGEFLRRQLDSAALDAYRQGNLVQFILHSRDFQGLWKAARKQARKADPTADLTADDYAALIQERYKTIEAALAARGLTLDDALTVLRANRGHAAGEKLGAWIARNKVDFPVDHGQVEVRGTFDDVTGRWVGNVIMRPNKFWRSSLGETVLAKHYAELRKAGFGEKEAFQVAGQVAERVAKYHMLDFANRLQIEQDLRWLSYFATKHRLYWKWVIGTFTRNPRYAAAVADFRQTLNDQGGVSLPVEVLGQHWQIPLERMVWVPGREYDETSPLAASVLAFVKSGGDLDAVVKQAQGTQGNVLTRSDTATFLGTKLLKIEAGKQAATYAYARAGLDGKTAALVNRALNEYQAEFFKEHGHYAPEAQAVKTVLLHQLGQEYWRANLPLPVVPERDRTDQQALLAEYMTLIDPRKRAEFLDQHPGFSDHFGVYDDPRRYLHNKVFFERWTRAVDAYRAARADLYAQAKRNGEWTIGMEKDRRTLSEALQRTRQKLLIEDAHSVGIDTKGGVPNGTTIPYGPWGKLVEKDPQFDPDHFLNALFPKLGPGAHPDVIGPLQRSLQNTLALLNDPQYVRAQVQTPEEIKTLKREILQKLDVFKSYPSDALAATRDTYQDRYVNRYWAEYDRRIKAILALPHGKRAAADAAFRAWRDEQDQPVTVDGVRFPAPLRMAWATLDPQTRIERLSLLAAKPFTSLADYELDLLDVNHPKNVSVALAALEQAKQDFRRTYPGQSVSKEQIQQAAKQIDRQDGYHGFYAYYMNTLTQPRIRQFEQTALYRDMPEKALFDEAIRQPALKLADTMKRSGNRSYYLQSWAREIEDKIVPWLDQSDQKPLRDYLARFGPDFLNSLPG